MPCPIPNPHPDATDRGRVVSNLDQEIFDYFFRHVFAGERGVTQAIINTLFQALYNECIKTIPKAYDPDNAAAVNAILARVSFTVVKRPAARASKHKDQPGAGR